MAIAIFYITVIAVAVIIWKYVSKPGERSFPVYDDELEAWQRWDDDFK